MFAGLEKYKLYKVHKIFLTTWIC